MQKKTKVRKTARRTEPERRASEERMKREAEEKQALLDTWKEVSGLSDFEDYEEADELAEQESVVIPRSGRAEETEDDLWESLTDEAVEAAKGQGEEEENNRRGESPFSGFPGGTDL